MKTFQVQTLGCKVNQYEAQAMREQLALDGLSEVKNAADIYVINTCRVTRRAERESRNLINRAYRQNPQAKIFVTGCSVSYDAQGLNSLQGVSRVINNAQKENLTGLIFAKEIASSAIGETRDDTVLSLRGERSALKQSLSINKFAGHARAFLKIQDGCNNGCSYCVVPGARGVSRSKAFGLIKEEAYALVKSGHKEIVLCGICLGAYGRDLPCPVDLVKVIEELEAINGLCRIRLSSIEASDVTDDLIAQFTSSKKLCRHLHIPFQSGDDKLLKLMNRKFTSDNYLELVRKARKACRDIAITTDIIVGFSQEDESSFEKTIEFLKEARPARMHIFSFSPREDTAAFNFRQLPAQAVVKERAERLKTLGEEFSRDFRSVYIGKELEALFELSLDAETGMFKGYTGNYIRVFTASGENLRNRMVWVKAIRLERDGCLADVLH